MDDGKMTKGKARSVEEGGLWGSKGLFPHQSFSTYSQKTRPLSYKSTRAQSEADFEEKKLI